MRRIRAKERDKRWTNIWLYRFLFRVRITQKSLTTFQVFCRFKYGKKIMSFFFEKLHSVFFLRS